MTLTQSFKKLMVSERTQSPSTEQQAPPPKELKQASAKANAEGKGRRPRADTGGETRERVFMPHINRSWTSNSFLTKLPSRTASQADIFERNVQVSESGLNELSSPSVSSPRDIPALNLSFDHPRHLASENYTSPILDSTVELIANNDFDNIDVVQVPHRKASVGLLRTCTRCTSNQNSLPSSPKLSITRKYSNSSSTRLVGSRPLVLTDSSTSVLNTNHNNNNNNNNNNMNSNVCLCGLNNNNLTANQESNQLQDTSNSKLASGLNSSEADFSPRKSISFYSYSDLVNFERMSHSNPNNTTASRSEIERSNTNNTNLDSSNFESWKFDNEGSNYNCPKHGLQRRPTLQKQGTVGEVDVTIDEQLDYQDPLYEGIPTSNFTPSETNKQVNTLLSPSISKNKNANAVDDESIHSWNPLNDDSQVWTEKPRHKSVVEDLASLKSVTTNNSFFEDELENCSRERSQIGEPLINICSAKDFLRTRSRELRQSFVDNDIGSQRVPITQ